jgi:hypothetical protein
MADKKAAVAVSGASPLTDSDSNFSEPNSALTDAVLIRKARGLANGLSAETKAPETEAPETEAAETKLAVCKADSLFRSGPGLWLYREPGVAESDARAAGFFAEARTRFGMRDGDIVLVNAGAGKTYMVGV